MTDMVETQLRTFILKTFPLARASELGPNELLLESGIIDSLGVLSLVGFIERTFQIEMMDDDLVPENFSTIDRLARLVRAKRESPQNGADRGNQQPQRETA